MTGQTFALAGGRRPGLDAGVEDAELDASRRWCRASARHHAKSFYFASAALPRAKKDAAYAVYAFCRHADDVIDEAADSEGAGAIRALGDTFDAVVAGSDRTLPFAAAFSDAVRRYDIPREPFFELLEGVLRDRGPVRIADWEELRDYCWHVASTVGLIMARIFGVRDGEPLERAVDLGIAMQLTNILRDIVEDFARDRIYLPADEMARHGITTAHLAERRVDAAFVDFMKFQIARARACYARSESGIRALDDDGSQLTVWLMRHVYSGILGRIERAGYDVFSRRASTSTPGKLALALRAWVDWRRHRR